MFGSRTDNGRGADHGLFRMKLFGTPFPASRNLSPPFMTGEERLQFFNHDMKLRKGFVFACLRRAGSEVYNKYSQIFAGQQLTNAPFYLRAAPDLVLPSPRAHFMLGLPRVVEIILKIREISANRELGCNIQSLWFNMVAKCGRRVSHSFNVTSTGGYRLKTVSRKIQSVKEDT
ncbi:uncharacterized protein BDR25DRAFT_350515 [Lindgomyces ingoldianus]|uniref:Uncharacterized protein n=1 Tax=Lindgomyces ingoldianus TaxID=673940 RepID=A0ACB6R8M9_9PLEO|nr:uncharacterized protein BDR25DRAFT_350515 [Lindgomyces ingoldianus]KAF2475105.1 hypothetical protein BDR25DRAFT_350515 [Lindgomyces ingoldianus]